MGSPDDLTRRRDLRPGWLQDRVAVAAGQDVPGEAEAHLVGIFARYPRVPQVIDPGLGRAHVLADPVELRGNRFVHGVRGEAERGLAEDLTPADPTRFQLG